MKGIKRTIGLLLALVMIVGVFAGCGKEDKKDEKEIEVTVVTEATEPAVMAVTDLAEYVGERTVTISVTGADFTSTGSGFFIDDNGTVVTCYHVIDGAESIEVEVNGGGKYTVDKIVDFNVHHDIAVLRIGMEGNPYLEFTSHGVRTGEDVYAVGSSLGILDGTFSDGIVSNTSRNVGVIDCIQTTAAISSGNSGGPLVNAYGEVVGINAFVYNSGQNLNLAVRIDTLDLLGMDRNFSINQYREWYRKETMRSYVGYDYDADEYYQTMINTYQHVTGEECAFSAYEWSLDDYVEGYDEDYGVFIYAYSADEFDTYTDYLNSAGFEFEDSRVEDMGTYYYYFNEFSGDYVRMCVAYDDSLLIIEACSNIW